MSLMDTLKASVALEDSKRGRESMNVQAVAVHKPQAAANLAAALAAAQSVMKAAPFDRTNPHFKSKYASLASVVETIRKPLADNDLSYTQTTEIRDGALILVTTLRHSSGETVLSEYPLPAMSKPQELGSALTYARRYSLSALVCIAADDDDDAEGARKSEQVATTAVGKTSAIAKEVFRKLQAEIREHTALDELYQWGANNENKVRKASLPSDWQAQIGAIYQEHVADLKKPKPTIPNPQNDPPGFAKWLDGRLTEFKDGHALSSFTNDTIMPMIEDSFPADREDIMGIIGKHEERLSP